MGKRTPQTRLTEVPVGVGISRNSPSVRPGDYNIDEETGQRTVTTPYGSIQYQPLSTERPEELQNLIDRFKTVSEQGYSAPEYAARRAQAANVVKAQQQASQRDLLTQQAKQGVRGGAAVAQQQRASQQMNAQRAALEQNLMLEDVKNRQAMMGQYGGLLGGAISREDRLALENLKRDIAAQVVGVGAGITEAQLGLSEKELEQAKDLFELYLGKAFPNNSESGSVTAQDVSAGVAAAGGNPSADGDTTGATKTIFDNCCFIFLEADEGVLNRVARKARDELMTPRNRRGYYKLAEVFVPLMRKSKIFKFAVKWGMVKPMIFAGKWKYKENRLGVLAAPIAHFWINMFDYLGGDHPFMRENGEII
jgi:hypothetical protein